MKRRQKASWMNGVVEPFRTDWNILLSRFVKLAFLVPAHAFFGRGTFPRMYCAANCPADSNLKCYLSRMVYEMLTFQSLS